MLHTFLRAFQISEDSCLVLLSTVPSAVHLHGPFFLQNFSFSVIPFHRDLNTRFLAQFKLGTSTLYSICYIFIIKLSSISLFTILKKISLL